MCSGWVIYSSDTECSASIQNYLPVTGQKATVFVNTKTFWKFDNKRKPINYFLVLYETDFIYICTSLQNKLIRN